jgi:hypothetical protein
MESHKIPWFQSPAVTNNSPLTSINHEKSLPNKHQADIQIPLLIKSGDPAEIIEHPAA